MTRVCAARGAFGQLTARGLDFQGRRLVLFGTFEVSSKRLTVDVRLGREPVRFRGFPGLVLLFLATMAASSVGDAMGKTKGPYKEEFPKGSRVKIPDRSFLEDFLELGNSTTS